MWCSWLHYYTDPRFRLWQKKPEARSPTVLKWPASETSARRRHWSWRRCLFHGETAKILNPKDRAHADIEATCSLDIGCPVEEFSEFCDAHPDRTVVVYANTLPPSRRADWVVTSSIAVDVIEHLHRRGEKILGTGSLPGDYVRRQTGADVLLWQGSASHEEFRSPGLAGSQTIVSRCGRVGSS